MGKGSVPDAPDVSGNVKNANKLFDTSTAAAGQQAELAKSLNAKNQATTSQIIGGQLPMMETVNNAATQGFQNYQSNYVPLQQQQIKQAQDYGSEANVKRLQGMAMGDVNSSFDAQRKNSQQQLAAMGVDPSTIHAGALDAQSRVQQAAAAAQAGTQSALQTENTARQMTNQAVQQGNTVNQMASQNAGTGSNIGSAASNVMNSSEGTQIGAGTSQNTFLQTGLDANKSAADIQHQGFQDQLAQAQAASQMSPMNSIASLAGTAMGAFMMEGGGPVSQKGALPTPPVAGSTDTKPAWLTPGEYVIPKDVVDFKGHEFFHNLVQKTRQAKANISGIPVAHPHPHGA